MTITLPPDPPTLSAARAQDDGPLWEIAAEKEFENFRSRGIIKNAMEQTGRAMKTKLVRIGNSRGIRLPKPFIEDAGLDEDVELEVHGNSVVIRPVRSIVVRRGST